MLRPRSLVVAALLAAGSMALAAVTAAPPRPTAPAQKPSKTPAKAAKPARAATVRPKVARQTAGLVINATFDDSIKTDPKGAVMMATINAAIGRYQSAFSTPITVNITFTKDTTIDLGGSFTQRVLVQYPDYLAALKTASANNPKLAAALATLPSTPTNPVNGSATVRLKTANARALGFAGDTGGQPDSIISLNTDIMNLDRSSTDPSKYDLMAVVSHEINEALGFGSAMDNLGNGATPPADLIQPDDLYRFDQTGARSFNTTQATQAFYSIDGGKTQLARFNQQSGGDFGDWFSPNGVAHQPQVQDAFATPGAAPDLGVELTRLAVLGYTPAGGAAAARRPAGAVRPAAAGGRAAGSRAKAANRLPSRHTTPGRHHLRGKTTANGPGRHGGTRGNGSRSSAG
jgi:hypothetical protein